METKLKILKKRARPFKGNDGEMVDYFWYKAIRLSDEVTIEFGSMNGDYNEGDVITAAIEKTERAGGKFNYKEIR